MAQDLATWLAASGYGDLQPSHSAAVQLLWAHAEGLRLTALAERAHVTKQTMSALVDQLEHAGYVKRVADPADGRAALLRLTARGQKFGKEVRAFGRQIEDDLEASLGPRRLEALRESLSLIHEGYRGTTR
jgi:DNA-binding MarR family transcriptional regulator